MLAFDDLKLIMYNVKKGHNQKAMLNCKKNSKHKKYTNKFGADRFRYILIKKINSVKI